LRRRPANLGWSAGATTLPTATLTLVHSTEEHCAPAWYAVLTPASLILSSTTSGDSRNKKVWGHCGAKEKVGGAT